MTLSLKPILAVLAVSLAFSGPLSAYTIAMTDHEDPENDYGDVNGTCNNGDGFTVRFQTDDRGRLYFTDLENQSSDLEAVIRRECGE